jgi:hypothetical protein
MLLWESQRSRSLSEWALVYKWINQLTDWVIIYFPADPAHHDRWVLAVVKERCLLFCGVLLQPVSEAFITNAGGHCVA